MALIISAQVHMGRNNPTYAHKNHSSHLARKKTNTVILPRTCSIEFGSKILRKDLSVRLERIWFDVGVYENKRVR